MLRKGPMARFGVIGSVNRDTIVDVDGTSYHSLGGALYTTLALARLVPEALVVPLTRIGADIEPGVRALLSREPKVSCAGLFVDAVLSFACELRYLDAGCKREVLHGGPPPLTWAEIKHPAADLDVLLVNFITGLELELDVLRNLRSQVRGLLVMDLHSLLLATAANGRRVAHVPPDWEAWVAQADALQMNASEAALLGGLGKEATQEQLAGFARELLDVGPRWVAITLGSDGALAVQAGGGEAVRARAHPRGKVRDTTGCGDVFLAAFGAGLIAGPPLEVVLQGACRAAGEASRLLGPAALWELDPLRFSAGADPGLIPEPKFQNDRG